MKEDNGNKNPQIAQEPVLPKGRTVRIGAEEPGEKRAGGFTKRILPLVASIALAVGCGSVVSDDDVAGEDNGVDVPADVQEDVPDVQPDEAMDVPVEAPDAHPETEADSLNEDSSPEEDSTETVDTYDCTERSRTETRVVVETNTICEMVPTTTDSFTIVWNEGTDCTDTTERESLESREMSFPVPIVDMACSRGDLLHALNGGFEVIVEANPSVLNSATEIASTREPPASRLVVGSSLGTVPNWSVMVSTFTADHFVGVQYDSMHRNCGLINVYGDAASSRAALGLPYSPFDMAAPVTEGVLAYGYIYGGTAGSGSTEGSTIILPIVERTDGSTENLLDADGTTVVGICTFHTVLTGESLAGYLWTCVPMKK